MFIQGYGRSTVGSSGYFEALQSNNIFLAEKTCKRMKAGGPARSAGGPAKFRVDHDRGDIPCYTSLT